MIKAEITVLFSDKKTCPLIFKKEKSIFFVIETPSDLFLVRMH